MQCLRCQHVNNEAAKFCQECGVKLIRACPGCGQEVSPQAKFCPECGTSLTGSQREKRGKGETGKRKKEERRKRSKEQQSTQTLDASRGAREAERRQLTVMFCDLVGSTALSEQLDPEELREVVRAYQEVSAAVIGRFEGHIAQYLGDGLLVYFGYPAAHEDDAQRAVRTGLDIVGAIHELPLLNTQLQKPLQVRIGIHTGLVVIGEMGGGAKRENLALGKTPNLAARLQGLAAPDTVVISAATQRLIQGYFDCQDLGPHACKGLSTPVPVYHVLGESGAQSRFEVAVSSGLTPLVGREEEVGLLLKRWEKAKAGEGQVVLLSGEAGIGKSRLAQELKEQVEREECTKREFRCSPYYQNSALYPLIEHVQRVLQFTREDSPQEKLAKLERGLEVGAIHELPLRSEVVPLFAALLSLPHPDGYPPLNLSPQKQKQKTQEALVAWLLAEAERKAVLTAWEDLHWADPSTLEVLSLCIDQAPTARLLLLLTFRPDFHPPWAMLSHLTHLTLSRLGRKQVEVMVNRVTGGKALPAEVVQQVVSKTDGVPLFVEELTKAVVEAMRGQVTGDRLQEGKFVGATHAAPVPPLAIPATLHDSLMARLDRLGTVKEIAQLGAVLGREFTYELLQAVWPAEETALQKGLTALVQAELLYQRGLLPQARYLFKHALIQDAAYQSLLKSKRQQYHQQIAQVLEEHFPETKEAQPELLAHHYTEAGLITQAIPYWQQAGERAAQRSAHAEAIAHLTKGLELLKTLPDTPERARQELTLQLALGVPLIATKGYTAEEVKKTYGRARELCKHIGDTPQLFPSLWGLALFYTNIGDNHTSYELSQQCLHLAQREKDPSLLLLAYFLSGGILHWFGEFSEAQSYLEQAIDLYDLRHHRSLAFRYGIDPGMGSLAYASLNLWLLGYPDQARERGREALVLAQELSHPFCHCFALSFVCLVHLLRREGPLAYQGAIDLLSLSREQAFQHYIGMGELLEGYALVDQEQVEEGLEHILQGRRVTKAMGSAGGRSIGLARLVEAYRKLGNVEEGLSLVTEWLVIADAGSDHQSEAELYRLKGELLLMRDAGKGTACRAPTQGNDETPVSSEAEACFQKAIDITRRQSAKSLELRAVMSLSRLWRQQGKKAEARQMLAEIYGWFTEGFDTADLQEAKALLDSLE